MKEVLNNTLSDLKRYFSFRTDGGTIAVAQSV